MENIFYYRTPLGELGIAASGQYVTGVFFGRRGAPQSAVEKETPLIKQAIGQIREYLAGERTEFDVPLALKGTPFQVEVWKALTAIPYGQTCTYGQIAAQIGNPKACRAVGMANNRNPVSIIVPCHRVVGIGGKLVGYGGGLDIKQRLLALEAGQSK